MATPTVGGSFAPPSRPIVLTVQRDRIPPELREYERWNIWRNEWKDDKTKQGRWSKEPFQALHPSQHAKTDDPRTWSSFEEAWTAYLGGQLDGVGITLGDELVGIDLDKCVAADGRIAPWAQQYIDCCDSYTEFSPSGTGVKIFVQVDPSLSHLPGHTKHQPGGGKIEIYTHKRYFTVTGHHLLGTPLTVEKRSAVFEAVYYTVAPSSVSSSAAVSPRAPV